MIRGILAERQTAIEHANDQVDSTMRETAEMRDDYRNRLEGIADETRHRMEHDQRAGTDGQADPPPAPAVLEPADQCGERRRERHHAGEFGEVAAPVQLDGHALVAPGRQGVDGRAALPLVPAAGTAYLQGGVYGATVCLPVPDIERNNNPNIVASQIISGVRGEFALP